MTFIEFVEGFCRVADKIIKTESVSSSLASNKSVKALASKSAVGGGGGSPKVSSQNGSMVAPE